MMPNNRVNTDSKKRRSFVAPLFAAGYAKRYVFQQEAPTMFNKEGDQGVRVLEIHISAVVS